MARYSDETGVPNTCPLIDEVIGYVKNLADNYSEEIGEDKAQEGNEMIAVLEKIRSSNSDLRDFGNQMYREKNEAESDRDYYEKEMNRYRDEIEDWKNENKSLRDEVDTLETDIESMREKIEF